MSIGGVFLAGWIVFWIVVIAALAGVVVFLKRRGVFRRAADDAKATLDQGAVDAATKVADKLTGSK